MPADSALPAITRGSRAPPGPITCAALIMVAVFSGFMFGQDPPAKMMRLGAENDRHASVSSSDPGERGDEHHRLGASFVGAHLSELLADVRAPVEVEPQSTSSR
jgi:hypothetical protein